MKKHIIDFYLNDIKVIFQEGTAEPSGGPDGDVVYYVMGNPTHDDGTSIKPGDKLLFKGYWVNFNKVIFPKEINFFEDLVGKITFIGGEEFNGKAFLFINSIGTEFSKGTVFEDINIFISEVGEKHE